MKLEELKYFIENTINKRSISKKLTELMIVMNPIPVSFSHDYVQIGSLYLFLITHSIDSKGLYILKDKNGKYQIKDSNFVEELFLTEMQCLINNNFKKHPTFKRILTEYLKVQEPNIVFNNNVDIAVKISLDYLDNKKLYTQHEINIDNFNLLDKLGWEKLYDEIKIIKRNIDCKIFIESFFSQKTKFLINTETYELGKLLKDSGLSKKEIREGFFSKISKYKDKNTFNSALKEFILRDNCWSKENVRIRIVNQKIKIIMEKDNLILIEIESYKEIKDFGSQLWCITTEENYYNSYKMGLNRQFILYNFDNQYSKGDYMIGITTDAKGLLQVAHDNHDKLITDKYPEIENILDQYLKPETNSKIEKRLQKEIELGVDKTIIIDLIIYYDLIDKGLKWIKKDKIQLNLDSIRFSLFLIQKDYKKYIRNVNILPLNNLTELGNIVKTLDEETEITKNLITKIINNLDNYDDYAEDIIPKIKNSNTYEYFNIIESIKSLGSNSF